MSSISRRSFLRSTALFVSALGAERAGAFSHFYPNIVSAAELPTELGDNLKFHSQASEGITVTSEGTKVTVDVEPGDILMFSGQKVEVAGGVYGSDEKKPNQSVVVAVVSFKSGKLQYGYPKEVGGWRGRERSRSTTLGEWKRDAKAAADVQATRTFEPGNCSPAGCKESRIIVLAALENGGFEKIEDKVVDRSSGLLQDLPGTIEYFPQAGEGIGTRPNETYFEKELQKGDIFVATYQTITIAGQTWTVDNPRQSLVVAVLVNEDQTKVRYLIPVNSSGWQGVETSLSTTREGVLNDLDRAAEVQATRAFAPGNCGSTEGCTEAKLIELALNKDGAYERGRILIVKR